MNALIAIFWISISIIFYSYFGYAILLFCFLKLRLLVRSYELKASVVFEPSVALVIPAYNEEDFIAMKITNTLELDYPAEKLSVVFITDGSTDRTPEIIAEYSQFRLMHQPLRQGKTAAINRVMASVTEPFVIFCDANTLLNKGCIRQIVKHYSDPKVGGVAGEKKILQAESSDAVSSGEGLYWVYESVLKKMDSQFLSVVGAAGELFSLRTALYEPIAEGTIIEDFVISLRVCLRGYVVRYAPDAYAMETASVSMQEEQKRKIRIAAGAFQAIVMLKPLLNIFKYPKLSFLYISHRILRWTLCPISLVLIFISNLLLVLNEAGNFYIYTFIAQCFFYALAILGWVFAFKNLKIKFLYIPYYFLFMNLSVFMGFYRITTSKQSVLWEKAERRDFIK